MSRSYKVTGINLKGMPMGESDRLLTVLTAERGLIRVIVPGARKHKSRLAGRSSQFVINELLVVQGKSLDKLVQAETVRSFPKLSADLARLTASQYLAELVLCQALSGQPQQELFALLIEQLQQLEHAVGDAILAGLSQGIFQLLMLAGVVPELGQCSVSQQSITPDSHQPDWQVGFDPVSGGVVAVEHMNQLPTAAGPVRMSSERYARGGEYGMRGMRGRSRKTPRATLITATELMLLRRLGDPASVIAAPPDFLAADAIANQHLWQRIERLLRQYTEHHFDRPIRSATLIDACFPIAVSS